jgi:hypothetical protein
VTHEEQATKIKMGKWNYIKIKSISITKETTE